MDEREPLYTTGRDINRNSHYGKEYGVSSKNSKQKYHIIQQSLGYIQRKQNQYLKEMSVHLISLQLLFMLAKPWK